MRVIHIYEDGELVETYRSNNYLLVAQAQSHLVRIGQHFGEPGTMDKIFAAVQIALEAHCKLIDLLADAQAAADAAGITDFDVGKLFQDALADKLSGEDADA